MHMNKKTKKTIKYAVALSTPILVGYLFLGFAYGILMQQQGLSVLWTFLMSAFVFAGTLQYAAIPLLTSVFNPIAAFILAIGINARHLFYGLAIFERYKKAKITKPLLIFTMADEAFSINASTPLDDSINHVLFYNVVSLLSYFYWNAFTMMGHVFANSFAITIKGLEFVLPALFFTLFLTMWKNKPQRINMIIGVVVTGISSLLISEALFIIVSMVAIVLVMGLINQKESNYE
jgi:4-azaleucine resistance transporter AzlC